MEESGIEATPPGTPPPSTAGSTAASATPVSLGKETYSATCSHLFMCFEVQQFIQKCRVAVSIITVLFGLIGRIKIILIYFGLYIYIYINIYNVYICASILFISI